MARKGRTPRHVARAKALGLKRMHREAALAIAPVLQSDRELIAERRARACPVLPRRDGQ